MSTAAVIDLPEWTEYRKKNGLDPLGMQNSSVNLYQTLIPGIGNVTLRMRYYGLYAWLSWIYAKRIGDTNPQTWQRMIRRAEALYALVAQRRGSEGGITGSDWAKETLNNIKGRTIDFVEAAKTRKETSNYYFALDWGAYGLAYASQLSQIGILDPSREHAIAIPSADIGEKLALAFDKELGDQSTRFYETIQRGKVSLRGLDAFAHITPSGIRKGGTERKFYEDILFSRIGPQDQEANSRRASLILVLNIAGKIQRSPTPDDVRWALYAGKDESGRPFVPTAQHLKAHTERWRIYHANDLCHVALECLLKFLLDALDDYPRGIAPSLLIARCVKDIMSTSTQPPSSSWNSFVANLPSGINSADQSVSGSELAIVNTIMAVSRSIHRCPADVARDALTLLALLHRTFREKMQAIVDELNNLDSAAFHSLLTEGWYLEHIGDAPLPDVVARIIEERVMRRHLWVALRKFQRQGDYTFLIESDDGLIRVREKDGPVFTNPRLGPAIRFLHDIHLLGENGLTRRGMEVLQAS